MSAKVPQRSKGAEKVPEERKELDLPFLGGILSQLRRLEGLHFGSVEEQSASFPRQSECLRRWRASLLQCHSEGLAL
jgi:hypothetical protein